MIEKKYSITQLVKEYGMPKERLLELCRKGDIGQKSDPTAKRGYKYLITEAELRRVGLTR